MWSRRGALGNYKNSPFAIGNYPGNIHPQVTKTEILNYAKGEWVEVADYEFGRKLN